MIAPRSRTLAELLGEQAERHGERPALLDATHGIGFAELSRRAARVAGGLREAGIGRGDRVALLLGNRPEFLEVLFGATALGAVVVPLSTWSTSRELAFLLADAAPKVLIAQAHMGERDLLAKIGPLVDGTGAPGLAQVYVTGRASSGFGRPYDALAGAAPAAVAAPGDGARARDTALLLYTSGSSAHPKAVPLDHDAIIENGYNIGERQGLEPGDRVLVPVPLFWSYGCANALPAAFTHGAALVVQERFDPATALDLVEERGCTAIYTLPAITSALLAQPGFRRERTRTLRTGLTIGSPQDVRRAATELGAACVCNIYGATETYGNCCVTPHDWPLARRAASQGPPLPGVELRIVDPRDRTPLRANEVGAVEVRGYVTRGYLGASAASNHDAFDEHGWFRTGDLAALDAEGCLHYAGRASEMIKRSGINVAPAEVEEVLQCHPGVALAGVAGAPDETLGEAIVAFVVCRGEVRPRAGELLEHCRSQLSSYKLPDRIRFLDELPLTPTGKLMRRDLARLAREEARG